MSHAHRPSTGPRPKARVLFRTLATLFTAFIGAAASAAGGSLEAQPLAPRSGPRGATLFSVVAPESSGVIAENKYEDPDMWGRRSREFDLGGIGSGVAIGDYDGDGRPDLFVVSKTESCRLFRNLGNWKFEDITDRAGVGDTGAAAKIWKQGATFADVNNDGRLDLYLCRFGAPNLLYVNQGDGTFKEQAAAAGLAVNDASLMAVFGDFDRDGWLDVFVQTNVLDAAARPEGERDYLFRNNRDGTFTDVTARAGVGPGPTHGNSALWWDFDHDGWPDLYVANDFSVPDALFRNNRDGTFTDIIARTAPVVPYSAMGADLGDVDNDGRLDLYVTDMATTTHAKDQRTMAETRARLRPPAEGTAEVPQFPVSALLLNTGAGRLLEAARLAGLEATDWTWSPRLEDFDNDSRIDLHVTNGMYREIHNQDLIGRRAMAGDLTTAMQAVRNSPQLAESNLAFRNLGGLRFENVSATWGLAHTGVSFGSATGDLDGDGDLDLLYCNYQAGPTLLRNDNDSGHRLVCSLQGRANPLEALSLSKGTRSNRFGIGATITVETAGGTQVRPITLGRGFMASSEPIAHFGLGDETEIRRLTVTWPSGAVQTFENLAADQRLTITEPAEAPDTAPPAPAPSTQFAETAAALGLAWTAREEPYDEFLEQRLLPFTLNRRGPALAVADLDGSGRDSVVLGGTTLDPLRVLRPAGPAWAPAEAPAFAAPPFVNDGPLLVLETNGDSHPDLLVAAGGASQPADSPDYQPRLYLNDGHGGFAPAPADALPELPISAGALCAADFDRDGRLDLFLGGRVVPGQYPAAPPSALLANRGGTFADVTADLAPALRTLGLVTAALWSDVDADGWPDLLVALEWGNVRCFRNEEGKGFTDWTEKLGFAAAGTGWWRSLATADFNGDGRPDYAVGNLGLNTQYRASPERPALLFVGAFGGRSAAELVEAYYEGDTLYPRRTRSELGAAIPNILKRFRGSNDYARASLPDLLGADRLAAATRLAATELRSGVCLSQPDGRYVFTPWPHAAQIAPANGLAAGDFNGDGFADLYVVHNTYAPAPSLGRFDGGVSQLLRGDGRGGFTPAATAETGLVVPGGAKALAVLDLDEDGWPDFLVSRNAASSLAFRNRGVAGRHSVRVVLQGPASNPTAIGARVTAEYADGTTTAAEVSAGSGYLSQSTAALFFGSPEANPLRRLQVRWPSGATTIHETTSPVPAMIRLQETAH